MSLILSAGEQVIKDWQYAMSDSKNGTSSHNLTVTNKRIVVCEEAKNYFHCEELPVDSVKRIKSTYRKKRNSLGVIFMFLGIALIVLGIIMLLDGSPYGALPLTVGILAFAGGVLIYIFLVQTQLTVNIYSECSDFGLGVSAITNAICPLFKKSGRSGGVKIKVNADIAKEVVGTLGSLIIANK